MEPAIREPRVPMDRVVRVVILLAVEDYSLMGEILPGREVLVVGMPLLMVEWVEDKLVRAIQLGDLVAVARLTAIVVLVVLVLVDILVVQVQIVIAMLVVAVARIIMVPINQIQRALMKVTVRLRLQHALDSVLNPLVLHQTIAMLM